MIESITVPTTENPHDRSVYRFERQMPSYSRSLDALNLALKLRGEPVREGVHATARGVSNVILAPYPLTDPLEVSLGQSGNVEYPFLARVSRYGLEDFLRERVLPSELSDALRELKNSPIEALEDGFEVPSDLAISNAERLLRKVYEISPQQFEVYATPDAEIAIRALAPRSSVILLCDSLGGALCLVNVNSGRRRNRYTSADALPDSFLEKALLDLKGESI